VRFEAGFETEESVHTVMELLTGGELFDHLKERKRFSEVEAADVALQLLGALDHLHSQDIVHRDVKLENLVYTEPGSSDLKLIDFGFAVRLDACPCNKRLPVCGTLQYMVPEVAAGSRRVDGSSDIWSAGSVVSTLLTGKAPYRGSEAQIRQKSKVGQIDWSRGFQKLSAEAQSFVCGLLMDPRVRPSASESLAHPRVQRTATGKAKAGTTVGDEAADAWRTTPAVGGPDTSRAAVQPGWAELPPELK